MNTHPSVLDSPDVSADVAQRPWSAAWRSLRVRQWWHFSLLACAPLVVGPAHRTLAEVAVGVAIAASSLAFAFAINAVSDRGDDYSAAKNPLVGAKTVPRPVHGAVWVTGLLALLLSPSLGLWTVYAASVSVLAGLVYSVGPRLKARPLLGTLCNAVIFFPLLFVGAGSGTRLDALLLLVVVFVVLLTQNQLVHEVADLAEDAAADVRTTAVTWGPEAALRGAAVLGVLGAAAVWWVGAPTLPSALGMVGMFAGGLLATSAPRVGAGAARRYHRWLSAAVGAMICWTL